MRGSWGGARPGRGLRGGGRRGSHAAAGLLLAALLFLPLVPRGAEALSVTHTVGNITAQVSDVGRLVRLDWNGVAQLCRCPGGVDTEAGLAIDQDNYDHAPENGPGRDGEGFFLADSFELDFTVDQPIYFVENSPAKQRSQVSFNHTGADPWDASAPQKEVGDLAIQQTAWTVAGGNWLVLQWEVTNRKATPLTGLRFTVYGSYSGTSTLGGVGGTGGDDLESWDPPKSTYYVRDQNGAPGATTMAVASAVAADPLDRYVTRPRQVFARNQPQDDVLYEMVSVDPNGLGSGVVDGISAVLGWANGGMTVPAGGVRVFAMVWAFGTGIGAADTAVAAARNTYLLETTGMKFTEIADGPTPQAEVWNDGMGPVDLTAWTVSSSSGPLSGTWAPSSVDSGEYSVFTVGAGGVGPEADVLTLEDGLGLVRDIAAWGWAGPIPDPLSGETVQRAWDPAPGRFTTEWSRAAAPSLGAANTALRHDPVPAVRLNEVAFNPRGSDAFLEVYYRGVTAVDLSGYTIVVDRAYTVPAGTLLTTTKRWFVLRQPDFPAFYGLTAAADNAYLYDASGRFLDMVGWAQAHPADTSVVRVIEGVGTAQGFEEMTDAKAGWAFDATPTMNLLGVQVPQVRSGNPGDTLEFGLNVTNFKADSDRIELYAASVLNGWPAQLLTTARTPLPDTSGDGNPDTGALGMDQTAAFIVAVAIPDPLATGDYDDLQVLALSSTEAQVSASLRLTAQVNPYLQVSKASQFPTVFVQGSGFLPEQTQLRLGLTGAGVPQVDTRPQDIAFEVDNSGSMTLNDPGFLRWDAVGCYINQMTLPDRGAIVAFGDGPGPGPSTAWYVRSPLTTDYALLYADTQDPANRFNSGGTPIKEALQLGNAELIANGDPTHVWVEILLSDGNPANYDIAAELNEAVNNSIRIFTIGLGPGVSEWFMRYIADTTGGEYFFADAADDLCSIYLTIGTLVQDTAASPVPGGVVPMIIERVPPPFDVVPGTIFPPPTSQWVDGNGDEVLEWAVTNAIRVGDRLTATYDVTCSAAGTWNATDYPLAEVNYDSWDGRRLRTPIPSLMIPCLPGIFLEPPEDLRTAATGGDLVLTWRPPADILGVDGYEIFRSPSPVGFDFTAPDAVAWGWDTLSWTDPGAASAVGEDYYVARTFNATLALASSTGNTAGAFTADLGAGAHALSLPLEPFAPLDAAAFQLGLGPPVPMLEMVSGAWVPATGPMAVGRGYFAQRSLSGLFTFTGRPAAMIRYQDGFGYGFGNAVVESLRASVSGADVALSWSPLAGTSAYQVYRSPTRDGFFTGGSTLVVSVAAPAYTDLGAIAPGGDAEVYYMIRPRGPAGEVGGGTYGLGIVRKAFTATSAFGLPLQPLGAMSVSGLTAALPTALGILWFDVAAGRWVPHFAAMPPGVYDAALSRAVAYQVGVRGGTEHVFIGW